MTLILMIKKDTHTERRLHQMMFADCDYERNKVVVILQNNSGGHTLSRRKAQSSRHNHFPSHGSSQHEPNHPQTQQESNQEAVLEEQKEACWRTSRTCIKKIGCEDNREQCCEIWVESSFVSKFIVHSATLPWPRGWSQGVNAMSQTSLLT
ncbi:PREDICTED: uncharacterized protein LOC109179638 [Ipomoea nil]|uniref:uncharacterized protein LOC109179638 n=1 Tax=Ipomoea nil TaxID=35883 RepID=UPI00090103D8|nr:PREDICTED: uncharacterized protein LOC109179638 [Ipomoea nil]